MPFTQTETEPVRWTDVLAREAARLTDADLRRFLAMDDLSPLGRQTLEAEVEARADGVSEHAAVAGGRS